MQHVYDPELHCQLQHLLEFGDYLRFSMVTSMLKICIQHIENYELEKAGSRGQLIPHNLVLGSENEYGAFVLCLNKCIYHLHLGPFRQILR